MPEFCVILVEPMIQGNIGAVARAMKNFDIHELRLVMSSTGTGGGRTARPGNPDHHDLEAGHRSEVPPPTPPTPAKEARNEQDPAPPYTPTEEQRNGAATTTTHATPGEPLKTDIGLEPSTPSRHHVITEEARRRAVHAQDILDNALVFETFGGAVKDIELKVATTGVVPDNQKRHLRSHLELEEFAGRIHDYDGKVALIFGRENFGLLNPEIERCDIVLSIPTSTAYPVLNLSHAVSVVLYHLFITERKLRGDTRPRRDACEEDRERLFLRIDDLLVRVNYPGHKRGNTSVMIRRILGRAFVSRWEYHTLMGVISRIEYTLGRGNGGKKQV